MGALAALALVSGCVSTPARRIAKQPEVFAAFPPEVQAQVRRGEIDIGFTADMVRLALGAPSEMVMRKTGAGTATIWLYTAYRYVPTMSTLPAYYTVRGRDGRIHHLRDPGFMGLDVREEYVVLRIEFENGKVHAIERLK
jgi:hypothetical protein